MMSIEEVYTLSKLRHKLVNKMLDLVQNDPSRLDQNHYPYPSTNGGAVVCNSPFCAAGFLVMAKSKKHFNDLCKEALKDWDSVDWWTEACAVLEVPVTEARSLFGTINSWPPKFADAYRKAASAEKRFEVFKHRWMQWLAYSDEKLSNAIWY